MKILINLRLLLTSLILLIVIQNIDSTNEIGKVKRVPLKPLNENPLKDDAAVAISRVKRQSVYNGRYRYFPYPVPIAVLGIGRFGGAGIGRGFGGRGFPTRAFGPRGYGGRGFGARGFGGRGIGGLGRGIGGFGRGIGGFGGRGRG